MTETVAVFEINDPIILFGSFGFLSFEIVSNFEIRASDFLLNDYSWKLEII
jgi:hypothetical protein